jgi:serine/alanine adding enzyme
VSFFQSEIYFRLLNDLPGLGTFIFNVHEPNGNRVNLETGIHHYVGSRIKRLFTSRVVIIGEPASLKLWTTELSKRADWQFEKQTGGSCIYSELRLIGPPRFPDLIAILPFSFIQNYLNILVDTSISSQVLFSRISASKRRQVLSSIKAGATVRPALSEEEVKTFYKITSDLYRKKIKKPLIPEDVFLRFFRNKNAGEVLLVLYDNKIVGGMLCPFYAKEEMYEWYIAGLDAEMKKHKVYPSVLVTWEAIRYASENGFRQFNFMGAGKQDQPYGVRDFKMRFGGKLVEAPRLIFVHKPFLYKLGKLALRLGLGY